jgi:protein-arginine kinase activator protein McsA
MLCCICKEKEATVHWTLTVAGTNRINKLDLCEECAQKKGVNDLPGFSLPDLQEEGFETTISHLTPEQAEALVTTISHLTPEE